MCKVCELYRPFLYPLIVITVLSLVSQAGYLAIPVYMGKSMEALYQNGAYGRIIWFASVMVFAFAVQGPIQFILDVNRNKHLDTKNRWHLTNYTLRRLLSFSLGQIASGNSGLRQATTGKGEYAVHEMVRDFIKEFTPPLVRIVLTLAAFLKFNQGLGLAVLGVLALYALISSLLDLSMLPKLQERDKLHEKVDAEHAEILAHLDLVVLSAEEDRVMSEFNECYGRFQRREEEMWVQYYGISASLRDPIIRIGFGIVTFLTIGLIQKGICKPSDFATTTTWSLALFTGLASFPVLQRKFMRHYSMVKRYFELLDLPPEVVPDRNPMSPSCIRGEIEFREVEYAHPTVNGNGCDIPALNGISLVIPAGKTVGVVGATGGGKSTLIKGVLRWYDPDRGVILVDGVDIRRYHLAQYRRQIGYVPQEVHLLDGTIRRNISLGSGRDLPDDELDKIARLIGIDRFYDRFGQKRFDTTVGELGRHLSGGQRQLIGIARALAKNPSLLIFDEATSSLDSGSQAVVQEAMQIALKGKTGIVIAHRLSTIRHLDFIVVMNQGRIVGVGTHTQLMSSCGQYQALVEHELRA
ncbi:MAG: ABC transporter ATP-binding protein [Candidatus Taylorbacteria bacterium]|nr:ABC transporter ATP-binding protein [Candidatus Taylorbacteria bacterium]